MTARWVDLGMNEGLAIKEADDGAYIVLWTLGNGPHSGNIYRVTIAELPDGQWRAQVPLMPQCTVIAKTREAAKATLIEQIQDYLRRRIAFIQDAMPLAAKYIRAGSHEHGSARHADDEIVSVQGHDIAVSSIIGEMNDAFAASSLGDDSLIIDPVRIAATAKRLELLEDVVRAAIAYYLNHKQPIRNRIVHDRHARLDAVFARLETESGLSEEELMKVLDHAPHDAA